ncbi:MAG TPA: TonB-dependent receptor [Desulfobacterales bacterium]|nr:TonB-dependent receptor [Desulfobacterales bacterium]
MAFYGGTYGTGRGVGVASDSTMKSTPFLVWEGYTQYGYRENSDNNRGQFFNKITFPVFEGDLSARFHYAARTWGDPGWLIINQIKAGIVNRRDAVNLTDRGDTEMADVVLNYSPKDGEAGLHGSLYYTYHWHAAGRTFPPSPQSRRDSYDNCFGWKLLYNYQPFDKLSLVIGNDLRYDDVKQNQWNTLQYYTIIKQTQAYDFNQFNTGFFAQGQYKPFSFFKLIGGLRYDIFDIDVDNKLFPKNSGDASPDIWSPKVGLVITPYKDINIFANRARGFSSPAVTQLSPSSATQNANFNLGLSKLDTWDVGCNALLLNRLYVSFDYFNTLLQGEQWLNPTTASYDNLGTSKRTGIEVEARIFLTKELTLYGNWTDVRARLKNPQAAGEYYISGIPEDQAVVGLEFQKPLSGNDQQIGFDFYYLRIGRKPVNAAGTLIGSQFDRYMSRITYQYKKWTTTVDMAFTPREYASDIYTTSSNQIAYTPYPEWEVIAGIRYQFK